MTRPRDEYSDMDVKRLIRLYTLEGDMAAADELSRRGLR
jgi:hypothetical protein